MRALAQAVRLALTLRCSRAESGVPVESSAAGVISSESRLING